MFVQCAMQCTSHWSIQTHSIFLSIYRETAVDSGQSPCIQLDRPISTCVYRMQVKVELHHSSSETVDSAIFEDGSAFVESRQIQRHKYVQTLRKGKKSALPPNSICNLWTAPSDNKSIIGGRPTRSKYTSKKKKTN